MTSALTPQNQALRMLSAEDFRARTYPLQASEPASMSAPDPDSFMNSSESFAQYDPATSSWKTSQLSLLTGLEPYSDCWPRQGTTVSGRAYRRQLWAPVTAAIGGGLLPTPAACVANDGERPETWLARRERVKLTAKNGNGMGMPLTIAAQLLPTLRTCSAMAAPVNSKGNLEGNRNPNLETVIGRMLPTPTTRDWKDGSQQACANVASNGLLGREIRNATGSALTGEAMYLNPSFVEEMMGYPVGWTALEP